MSVLIRGMEMPSIDLEWRIIRGQDGKWYAIDVNAETSDGEWHEIVPVPPHGRLGDLDEIVRYKERLVVDADKINPAIRYVVDTKYIEGTPTIIPAEEGET